MSMLETIRKGNPIPGWFLGDGRIYEWSQPVQAILNFINILINGSDGSEIKEPKSH